MGHCLEEPPLCIRDKHGAMPWCKMYAIPVHNDEMEAFVDRWLPDFAHVTPTNKALLFTDWVRTFLPREWEPIIGTALIPMGYGRVWEAICVVIGSNLSEEDRQKAKNRDLIDKVKEALGIQRDPGWYVSTPWPF